jgi:hypothetical protein
MKIAALTLAALALLPLEVAAQTRTLLCTETDSAGFQHRANGRGVAHFNVSRFILQVTDSTMIYKNNTGINPVESTMTCDKPFHHTDPHLMACHTGFQTIAFNRNNMRFVRTSYFGWVGDVPNKPDQDSLIISYGACVNF